MKLFDLLSEALKPSQYRNLVKGWDKAKYAKLFDDKYRIYLPLTGTPRKVKPNAKIAAEVKSAGYDIEDYVSGIASKDGGKRKIRIGKILKDPVNIKRFANDPARAATKSQEQVVVISRHPYDIAGMSTDRGWTSCMNLKYGVYNEYVPIDIKEGSLVAYLIDVNDKNIEKPIARIMIKPFVDIKGKDHEVVFGLEDKVYGTANAAFKKTVTKWVDEVNKSKGLSGIFKLNPNLYNDSPKSSVIKHIGKASKEDQIAAIKHDSNEIQNIKDPDKDLQLLAVKENGYSIHFIKDPDKDVQLAAVEQNGSAIEYIKNPDKDVQLVSVKQRGYSIQFIKDPDKDVQLVAVKKNGRAIEYIKNPDKDVQIAAVKEDGDAIRYIKDPDKDVQLLAVKQDGFSIRYIKNPDKDVQIAAVKETARAIEYIKNPDEDVKAARWGN